MRLISWNVNGLRAVYKKGFEDFFCKMDADLFCIQETKVQEEQLDFEIQSKYKYFNSALKKGYSGTAIFSKKEPISINYGIGIEEHDNEGRVITLEFDDFYLVNCYTPNSQRELTRLEYRMIWEEEFLKHIKKLDKIKPVILCGDLNVAHKEIDLKNPKTNRRSAGFTDEERYRMTKLLEAGFIDTYRYLYPDKENAYTWWSYMANARQKDIGWRIDYFIVSENLKEKIEDSIIHKSVMGSDHCPIELQINI